MESSTAPRKATPWPLKRVQRQLQVVGALWNGRVFKSARSSGVSGRRRAMLGSAHTPRAKLACFSAASARSRRDCAGGSFVFRFRLGAGSDASRAKAKPLARAAAKRQRLVRRLDLR